MKICPASLNASAVRSRPGPDSPTTSGTSMPLVRLWSKRSRVSVAAGSSRESDKTNGRANLTGKARDRSAAPSGGRFQSRSMASARAAARAGTTTAPKTSTATARAIRRAGTGSATAASATAHAHAGAGWPTPACPCHGAVACSASSGGSLLRRPHFPAGDAEHQQRQEVLGHSTIGMTERYSHLAPNAKHEAVASLDQRVEAPESTTSWQHGGNGAGAVAKMPGN
jgi:hypothetical protein